MIEKSIGDYRVMKERDVGSLGPSFLVEHKFTKKHYNLKFLPEEMAQDRSFIARFQSEVERMAALDHPHLVALHTVTLIEGRYCFITEVSDDQYGEGKDVGRWLLQRKEKLSEEQILTLLRHVAAALDYAYKKEGLVHGLLKLSNIILHQKEKTTHFMVTDMGLMTIVGQHAVMGQTFKKVAEELAAIMPETVIDQESYKTYPVDVQLFNRKNSSFLENYAFLSPEQKKGQVATRASDCYAFGILAYYLLTSTFPEGYFPMPSELRPRMHFDFDTLIRKTIALDPTKRAEELLPLLERAIDLKIEENVEAEKPEIKKSILSFTATSSSEKEVKKAISIDAPVALLASPKDESYAEALKAMLHRDPVVTHYQPQKRLPDQIEPLKSEMEVISAGCFTRGSNGGARDEMPMHQIYLHSFAIDIHPVTNEQFVRFLEYMGHEKDDHYNDLIRLKESRLHRSAGLLSIESGYAKHPVVGVTWYGAVAYAQWVKKRLPTEAEWEVAAAGGLERTLYPTGETIERSQANFFSSDTTAVKSYPPNGYGLYDMAGNVYEWCQDWYGYNYYEMSQQEPNQPQGPVQGVYRVLRGGCWKSLQDDLRCAHRHRNNPGTVNGTYGFRCVSSVL